MNRWVIVGVTSILTILLYIIVTFENVKSTKVTEVIDDDTLVEVLGDNQIDLQKRDAFIQSKLPEHIDNMIHFDKRGMDANIEDRRREVLSLFFYALKNNDSDAFILSVSDTTLEDLWEEEIDFDKRLGKLQETLMKISRNNLLQSMKYTFNYDKYDIEQDRGTLYLLYEDDVEVKVNFEIELVESKFEKSYHFSSPIVQDIYKELEEIDEMKK